MKRALSCVSAMMASARKNLRTGSVLSSGDGSIFGSTTGSSGGGGVLKATSASVVPVVPLSPLERRIFELLLSVVRDRSLGLTLRVAGGWVRDKLLLRTTANDPVAAGSHVEAVTKANSAAKARRLRSENSDVVTEDGFENPIGAIVRNATGSRAEETDRHGGDYHGTVDSVDIDIALDKMMGENFAWHVSKWLVANNHPPASYGVIASNPDQSKHLATARMKVLGVWIDFVNLRTETYAESTSRIPDVAIGTPIEDAMRRDLTINALFYNINTGTVEDFTGHGIADLKARVVRTPLAPLTTLLDDPLRALRAIRFASRLNFIFDPELYRACADPQVHKALGAKVSRERISNEIDSIMASAAPIHALGLLCELGLFSVVFRFPPESEYVDDIRPSPDIARAALGCLINMDRLCHSRRKIEELPSRALFDTRIARYAALLAPVANVKANFSEPGRRVKQVPLAQYLLRTELRMSTKDVAAVVGIHQSSMEFKALVHSGCQRLSHELSCSSSERSSAPLQSPSRSKPVESEKIKIDDGYFTDNRLAVGRVMRSAGPLWRVALQVAMITELSPATAADTYARGMTSMPEGLEADAAIIVATYEDFERGVEEMALDGVWDLKPIIDGRELMKLLPRLPRGPIISQIMAAQVDELIKHPQAEESTIREWIVTTFNEYR